MSEMSSGRVDELPLYARDGLDVGSWGWVKPSPPLLPALWITPLPCGKLRAARFARVLGRVARCARSACTVGASTLPIPLPHRSEWVLAAARLTPFPTCGGADCVLAAARRASPEQTAPGVGSPLSQPD